MPRLVVQSEEQAGQIFDLRGEACRLGRINENEVVIQHKSISSHHAEFILDGNDYLIKDLDSTNGTRVNGERVKSIKLRRGDLVRVGNIELIYESEFAPDVKPLPEKTPTISLSGCGFKGLPPHFKNDSLIPKSLSKGEEKSIMLVFAWLILGASLLYYSYKVFIV